MKNSYKVGGITYYNILVDRRTCKIVHPSFYKANKFACEIRDVTEEELKKYKHE